MARHAPGIPCPPLERLTPEEARYIKKGINAELKSELDLRIAFAKAGARL